MEASAVDGGTSADDGVDQTRGTWWRWIKREKEKVL